MPTRWLRQIPRELLYRSRTVTVMIAIGLTLSACGSERTSQATNLEGSPTAVAQVAQVDGESGRCSGGHLTVGDLRELDATRDVAMTIAYDAARAWKADARLIGLRVSCALVGTDIRWRATFYSKQAEALLVSDTGEVAVAPVEAEQRPTLVLENLSFGNLGRWLAKASLNDATVVDPVGGIEVRASSEAAPFGPPDAPRDGIYFHVAIADGTDVKDLFVDAANGTIYRYR